MLRTFAAVTLASISILIAALERFRDSDTFFRRHLNTQPKSIDPTLAAYSP